MRRSLVVAATAALVGVAGCASMTNNTQGRPGTGVAVSPSVPLGSPTGVPAPSIAPTGPAATAGLGTPPPVGKHAVARVGSVTVNCPDEAFPAEAIQTAPPLAKNVSVKAVVRCETVERSYPDLGEWSVQVAEVATSGFDGFLAELRKPSLRQPPNVVCTADLMLPPWFALVDQSGQVLHPAIPTDECAKPQANVIAALNRVDFHAVDTVRTAQVSSPESVGTGCPDHWKDMVAFEGAAHPKGTDGGSVADLASPPPSVLVCLYKAGPVDGGLRVGDLLKGATVAGDAAPVLASDAAIVGPLPAKCADADEFVVIANSAYVEIGGCNRLLTGDGRLGAADSKLIAQVRSALGLS